jgi:hypothetical protein
MSEFPTIPTMHYNKLRHDIRSGDIILCSGRSLFSKLIQQATHSVWSHVAFVLRIDIIDRLMILESVESIGVRAVPLSSYINDYNGSGKAYPGRIMLARHKNIQSQNINNLSKQAVDLLGYPYARDEIVHIAARISTYSLGLPALPHDPEQKRSYICSEYAYTCFKSVGVIINYNPMGFVAPMDFARSPDIQALGFIHTDCKELVAS